MTERLVHQPLARDARKPDELRGFDDHGEVRFAGAVVTHVPGMVVAVVDHLESRWRELFGEAGRDQIGDGSGGSVCHRAYISRLPAILERLPDVPGPRKDRPNARFHGRIADSDHLCDYPGCDEPGEFRAPPLEGAASGDRPGRYRWFCLDHVRAFNAGYNFFDGMTADEIHSAQRPFAGWERETRAFAHAGGDVPPRWTDFADPLDAIGARFKDKVEAARRAGPPLSDGDRRALKVLGLAMDADKAALRKRYAELLQRYHPDHNGGDRSHERVLQAVIEAYQRLRKAPAFA